jgi:ankyrin repeat protein
VLRAAGGETTSQSPRSRETPLFYAARLQRSKTLALLLDAGADPSIRDDRGRDTAAIARARRLPEDIIARLERAKQ